MAVSLQPMAGTAGDAQASVEALASERFVASFLDQSPRSTVQLLPTSAFIAYLWAQGAGPLWAGLWLAAVVLVTAWRWRFTAAYVQRAAVLDRPRRVRRLLFLGGLLQAVPTLGFAQFDDFGRAALTMLLIVPATVSIITTSGFGHVYRAFAWPMLLSVASAWLVQGWLNHSAANTVLGLGILMYTSFLHGVARHASAVFMETCAYRFGEQQLNAELKLALAAADEANRSKTQFLAAASHDLRQPMHSMGVLVAALSLRPLDTASRELVTLLGSVNQVLSRQLDTLLDMSKLDAGVVRAHRSPQRLDQIVEDHHAATAPVAQQHGLRAEVHAPQPVWVNTDPTLLSRALSNLTDNAIKFTPAGGLVRLVLRHDGKQAWLTVGDNGIGIAADEQGRVFHEFYQVGNTERDRSKGLGLGLSIVQRLCKLLQLGLVLESAPGRGTTVTLAFDLVPAEAAAEAVSAPARVPTGLSVMVVDDEATVRVSMRLLLTELGCTVHLAEGVDQARALAQTQKVDLVLSDLRLRGGESGVAAIDAVRALQPGVAAVLVTGDTAPERLRALESSGLRLLFKPVSMAQLMSVMPSQVRPASPPAHSPAHSPDHSPDHSSAQAGPSPGQEGFDVRNHANPGTGPAT